MINDIHLSINISISKTLTNQEGDHPNHGICLSKCKFCRTLDIIYQTPTNRMTNGCTNSAESYVNAFDGFLGKYYLKLV